MQNQSKIYAYFLPQFHECDYNNKWWGKGFTEWTNVKSTKPIKNEHHQPRIPEDGYYDLLEEDEISKQFRTAKSHGIDGFVIYHYWYNGDKPLGKPVEKILADKHIDIEFSLCWANHSWTKSWKNRKGSLDVLIEQTYETNIKERVKHYEFLSTAFFDERYITVDKKPLFQIYIPEDIPELEEFIKEFRLYFKKNHNSEIHLAGTLRSWKKSYEYLELFDSITLAQPTLCFFSPDDLFSSKGKDRFLATFSGAFIRTLPNFLKKQLYIFQDLFYNKISYFDYDLVWKKILQQSTTALNSKFRVNFSAFVDFDNSPRYKKNAKIVTSFSPEKFEFYLKQLIELNKKNESEILFINAWNEWGEGMYLENDDKHSNKKLISIKNAKEE